MIRLVVRLRNNGLDLHARRGRTGVDWGQEVKVEILARLRRRRIRLNRYEYRHRFEQGGVKNSSLIDVFRMVWQAGYDGFAQSLQLIRFSQRGHCALELLPHSRTLRLGKISRIRHTTKADSGITVNRHHRSIGKHQLIERHVRRLGRGKVATKEPSGTLAHRSRTNCRNMSLDRRACGDRENFSGIDRLHQPRGNGLPWSFETHSFFERGTEIIAGFYN